MIKLTEVSGIHKLSVSDFGEKLMIPRQLSSVSRTQATIVHSGCKATCKQKIFGNEAEIFLKGFSVGIINFLRPASAVSDVCSQAGGDNETF